MRLSKLADARSCPPRWELTRPPLSPGNHGLGSPNRSTPSLEVTGVQRATGLMPTAFDAGLAAGEPLPPLARDAHCEQGQPSAAKGIPAPPASSRMLETLFRPTKSTRHRNASGKPARCCWVKPTFDEVAMGTLDGDLRFGPAASLGPDGLPGGSSAKRQCGERVAAL